ncbi:hypothetical protein HK414_22370 [Ramlibacter terrae]|uniref:Uncharacterized protein n=1 Tax=Ramlibacter terrae TaxID=2732511 RepID=A0ABX6P1L8_9BURK|nr:hypothetical protein HK414_22370 [Ramlibacter terrae]
MLVQAGQRTTGIERVAAHAAIPQPLVDCHREQRTGRLRLAIGIPRVPGRAAELDVVVADVGAAVTDRADGDDPCAFGAHQRRLEQPGQQVVAKVVHGELPLDAVVGVAPGAGHDPRVVHRDVQRRRGLGEGLRECAHAGMRTEVERQRMQEGSRVVPAPGIHRRLRLGHVDVGHIDGCSCFRQRAGGGVAETRAAAGDERGLAAQVGASDDVEDGGLAVEPGGDARGFARRIGRFHGGME